MRDGPSKMDKLVFFMSIWRSVPHYKFLHMYLCPIHLFCEIIVNKPGILSSIPVGAYGGNAHLMPCSSTN